MIFRLIQTAASSGDIRWALISVLISVPVILFALTFHEFSHGYVAYKMGDPTARNLGRLTLNPIKHLDPIGTLCMLFAGFGWAKPIPVNARNFKKPRNGMAFTALAGPLSNIILSFAGLLLYRLFLFIPIPNTEFAFYIWYSFSILLYTFHYLNLSLAIFNLIPIPPLDGSRILFVLLPDKYYFGFMKYERIVMIAIMALLFTGTLSGPLAWIIDTISSGMDWIIRLIPFL